MNIFPSSVCRQHSDRWKSIYSQVANICVIYIYNKLKHKWQPWKIKYQRCYIQMKVNSHCCNEESVGNSQGFPRNVEPKFQSKRMTLRKKIATGNKSVTIQRTLYKTVNLNIASLYDFMMLRVNYP